MNLLKFQTTLSGQDFRLRKLGIAAAAVFAALNQSGAKFIATLGEIGPDQAKELLGQEGADQALQIAKVIADAGDQLRKIYPVESTAPLSTPTPVTVPGSEPAGSGPGATAAGENASTSGQSDGTKPGASKPAAAGHSSKADKKPKGK